MEQNRIGRKWPYTLGRVLLFCLACAIALILSSVLTKGLPVTWQPILSVAAAGSTAFLLTLLFVRWEGISLLDVGVLPGRHTLLRLLSGLLIGSVLAALQTFAVSMTGHLTLVLNPGIAYGGILINLLLYIAVACREEVAFRGYPLQSLNKIIGSWGAQLIVAVIFIAEHAAGGMIWWQAILGPGIGALLFGMAAIRTKGIALPIGLHIAWNFGQWALGFKDGAGIYQTVIEKGYETRVEQAGWLSYMAVMALAIAALYLWKRDTAAV